MEWKTNSQMEWRNFIEMIYFTIVDFILLIQE